MKTTLVFEYEWKEEDGIGTSCDALHCAYVELLRKAELADSMDDVADVFKEIRHGE